MSRRDQLVIQFILWLAIGTFLFGVWAIAVGLSKSSPAQNEVTPTTNAVTSPAN